MVGNFQNQILVNNIQLDTPFDGVGVFFGKDAICL